MPTEFEVTSPSRRRSRLDSSSSQSAAMSAKRPKFGDITSSKAKGKMPEQPIDLTKPPALQPHSGAKRLVIKNLRASTGKNPAADEYYARTEKDLEAGVEAVLAGMRQSVTLERLYQGVENVCRKGNAESIYRMLKGKMEGHVQGVIMPKIKKMGYSNDIEVAGVVFGEWNTWNSKMITIRSTFSYLDRTHLLREKLPSINDLTISYFKRMLFVSNSQIGDGVIKGLCSLIQHDRAGDNRMDAMLLKGLLRTLYVLGAYVKYFEPVFIQWSTEYFQQFAETHSQSNLKMYIKQCEALLQREQTRCLEYSIDAATQHKLLQVAHELLIETYSDMLLDSGSFSKLLTDNDAESVQGLYHLLSLSRIEQKLCDPWTQYIRATGAAIIGDKEHGDEMVLRLLKLRRAMDLMVRDAFSNNDEFFKGMRDAFGIFMNDRKVSACWDAGTSKIGEMTAKHIDLLLRGGLKTMPKELLSDTKDRAVAEKEGLASTADEDAELERQLDQVIELFRFLEGKDAFETFYKKDLAKRLLMGRSASHDAERSMLTKLRGECGSNFTHNLEQMFKDQELSKDEMEAYVQWCEAGIDKASAIDLQVMVLSKAAWPTYPEVKLNLPDEVATQIDRFDKYYKNRHTGRILTWMHCLAHCSVKAKFPKGTKELLLSGFQAVILLLFNSVENDGFLAYEQISLATGLKGGDLDRTLQSLACGKARVLTKHPKGRDVSPTDTFTFNKTFTDPKARVKINQIQLKETKEENKATHERIVKDRRFETQAAIVRIMKSRKRMGHAELYAEVIDQTKKRGRVEIPAIKKEIDSLVDKDYLERDGDHFVYLS